MGAGVPWRRRRAARDSAGGGGGARRPLPQGRLGCRAGALAADAGHREVPRRKNRPGNGARRLAPMIVDGKLRVPGDKSISHRALMLAALGDGTSRVRGLLASADVRSTALVLRGLGVPLPDVSAGEIVVRGVGRHGLRGPAAELDCGNSGTTARLMTGILAASSFSSRLIGASSLSRRPMQRVARPLQAMGARIAFERGDGLPMTIRGGPLKGLTWHSEMASAQVKSRSEERRAGK